MSQYFSNLSDLASTNKQQSPSPTHEVKRLSRHAAKKMKSLNVDERVGKRHITELRRIRLEVQEKGDSSDDEDFIKELLSERDRKMQQLKSLQDWHQTTPKTNKLATNTNNEQQTNGFTVAAQNNHVKTEAENLPDLPPLEEIEKNQSTNIGKTKISQKRQLFIVFFFLVTLEERPMNSIVEDPESSYFSLLRYFFCQSSANSLTIPDLLEAIQQWESNANRQLVTWIGNVKQSNYEISR